MLVDQSTLVMHEKRKNDDDRERDPEQPKKRTATETHGHLLFLRLSWPVNTDPRVRFPERKGPPWL